MNFLALQRVSFNYQAYSEHSYWTEAASTTAKCVEESLIQILGRCQSTVYFIQLCSCVYVIDIYELFTNSLTGDNR